MADVEENKPEPDLDELLELFREPEEEPRRKKTSGSIWLMAALVMSLVGGWMAAVVANRPAAKHSTPGPPVLPTKVSDRAPRGANGEPLGVVEDYIARCKKGMTAQQVRWIIEDFQKAGLDQELGIAPAEDFIRQRKAQHAWYLDLLADGLHLDAEQRRMASEKLAGLLEEAVGDFQKELSERASEPIEKDGGRFQLVSAGVIAKLVAANQWLTDERYAPWELCDLADYQLAITHHDVGQERSDSEPSQDGEPPSPRSWLRRQPLVGMGAVTRRSIEDILSRQGCEEAGSIFPFDPEQQFSGTKGELLEVAKRLHPAQLKTILLLKPELANEVSSESEKASE